MRFEGQTKLFGRIRTRISGLIKGIFYILLGLLIIWLIGNIIQYIQGSLSENNLQSVFLLKDKPELSIILLLVVIALFWISRNQHWNKLLNLLTGFKLLNRITQATILLSAIFYVTLFIATRFASTVFKNDWTLLIVASIPILVLIVLVLLERAKSVEFAGIKIELQRTTLDITKALIPEKSLVEKDLTSELSRIVEEAKREESRILLVRLGGEMHVEFPALRNYVYELSKVAPIEYIVFIDEDERYLGFCAVEKFKAKYPKFGIEMLLDDIEHDEHVFNLLKDYIHFTVSDIPLKIQSKYLRDKFVLSLWDPNLNQPEITKHDLNRLGAMRLFLLQKSTVSEAYDQMAKNSVSGIPVIDEKWRFIGMVNKDKVLQEVITQLVKNA